MTTYYFRRETIEYLSQQFVTAACNARNKQGLRLFVRREAGEQAVITALAAYLGGDVLLLERDPE